MLYNLYIRIISQQKLLQAKWPQLFSATVISFKEFKVRTIEGRLAGRVNPDLSRFRHGSGNND